MTQGVPESVRPPSITPLNAESLHLSWSVPGKPNGVIKQYQLWQGGRGLIYTDITHRRQHTVTGEKSRKATEGVCRYREGAGRPRGVCLIYEVTLKGRVLLTYGQVPLIHANRRAHTGSNNPQQRRTSEIIYTWL